MKEFFEKIEVPILFLFSGLVVLIADSIVFIVFLKNKELRTGIYGTVLACIVSEIFTAFHTILSAILILISANLQDSFMCRVESFISVFFSLFWVCENTSIMILYLMRKLEKSRPCNLLHLLSFVFSIAVTIFLDINKSLGVSINGTCFINKDSNYSIIFITIIFILLTVLGIIYNFWFFKYRDTKKDRSFINGYNYFILISSFLNATYFINLMVEYINNDSLFVLNFICVIFLFISSIFTAVFRIKIEHITLFFCDEDGKNKYFNIIKFIFCKYNLPKFKEIKKKLNVKYIESVDNNEKNMIYSHIFNIKDFS